jgi:hypothetical protein
MDFLFTLTAFATAAAATSSEEELVRATWALVDQTRWVAIGTFASAIALAGVAVFFGVRQSREQKQINMMNAMSHIRELLEELGSTKGYGASKNLRDWSVTFKTWGEKAIFSREKGLHKEEVTEPIVEQANNVEDVFEEISRIVNDNLVRYEQFSDSYGPLLLEFWEILKEDIEYKRKRNPNACINFEKLARRLSKRG